jgi:predicted acyltransferase
MKYKPYADGLKERLHSLDALRGFAMFWIIGGGAFFEAAAEATEWGWMTRLARQVHQHVEWSGFHFYDLVFPLFMFMSGVTIPFAITSKLEKGEARSEVLKKIARRMVLLIVLGLIYNGALQHGFRNLRMASVLAQIGISYFLAALIVIHTRSVRPRIYWLTGILGAVAVLQLFVPAPGLSAGTLNPEGSINAWIDQHVLPGKFYFETYDPEGILSIVSATSVTLMGALAGNLLRGKTIGPERKTIWLLLPGVGLVAAALVLSPVYPIIKNLWTVPFNLLTAGLSFLLLCLFYFVIDGKGWRKGSFFFTVIGLNSITAYLGVKIIDFYAPSNFLLGWLAAPAGDYGEMTIVAGVITIEWLCLYHLCKYKIFLKV